MKQIQEFIQLEEEIKQCNKCGLGNKCNKHVIWAYTTENPKVVFLGIAPGAEEDRLGLPFIGRSGKLLMKWIQELELKDWACLNCLKCHTRANRYPRPYEIEACRPFLDRQLELLKPELVICLGQIPTRAMGFDNKRLLKNLGKIHYYKEKIKMICFVHPSYCLRFPNYEVPLDILKKELMVGIEKG
jgi:uracil-DNA glycosylase